MGNQQLLGGLFMAKKITQEEFEQRIKIRFPNEDFKIIEYKNMGSPLKIQCLKCNKILENPQAKNFLAKNKIAGCSDCNGLRAKNTKNLNILQNKYDILNTTRDDTGKLWYTCKCKICGRISTHQLVSFLENTCRCEGNGNRWTEKEFKERLVQEYGEEYKLISPFKTINDKSLFKHSCGFVWPVTPAHILYNNSSCPQCFKQQSKGCKIIEKQLQELNITYEKEKFLRNSLQRFDFYLEINNKKYAIEYNGEQHYKYIPFFHGHDINIFKKYQERDQRKIQYCIDNDINLIIISYTLTNDEIKAYINKLFNSSTTSFLNVGSSEPK